MVKKALKKASSAYRTYNLSPSDNGDKLQEAIAAIETATEAEDTKGTAKAWIVKGDIYNSICTNFQTMSAINPDYKKEVDNAAVLAFEAYNKATEYAEKRDVKAVHKGIGEVQGFLVGEGASYYEKQDYETAYTAFQYSLDAHDFLLKNEKKSIFADDAALQDQMYYTGLAALNAEKLAEAKPHL